MTDSFGLDGIRIVDTSETYLEITHSVELTTKVVCHKCSSESFRLHQKTKQIITDAPARGKKVRLVISRSRYNCKNCHKTFMQAWPQSIEPESKATKRLLRYVETIGCQQTIRSITRDVGLSESTVNALIRKVAKRLYEDHRFPEPEILGMDDLRLRKRLHTVLTDGTNGRAVAFVRGGKETDVIKELNRRKFNPSKVKIFVSDLGTTNIAVKKSMFPKALHVADKWHVLKGAQEALSKVINQEVLWLRKNRHGDKASTIVAVKSLLMKGRMNFNGGKVQLELKLDRLKSILVDFPRIGQAFWAKIRLHRVYASQNVNEAISHLIRFARRALSKSISKEFDAVLKRIFRFRKIILNYFRARNFNKELIHPTTGPTERKNSDIRKVWRAGRGVYDLEYLSMRALYHPYMLHGDIVLCGVKNCTSVMGPLPESILNQALTEPAHARCSLHP